MLGNDSGRRWSPQVVVNLSEPLATPVQGIDLRGDALAQRPSVEVARLKVDTRIQTRHSGLFRRGEDVVEGAGREAVRICAWSTNERSCRTRLRASPATPPTGPNVAETYSGNGGSGDGIPRWIDDAADVGDWPNQICSDTSPTRWR